MSILTIVGLGTFGIWAYNAIKSRHLLDSEEHTEHMAAIAVMGLNREGKPPLMQTVEQIALTENPNLPNTEQEG